MPLGPRGIQDYDEKFKPGPKYNVILKSYVGKTKFGKSLKNNSFVTKEMIEVPGPGEYDVK